MTREEKQIHQKVSQKSNLCLMVSLGLVLSLAVVKMVFSNRAATWGHQLEALKKQTYAIQKQNLHLKTQLAQKTGGLEQLAEIAQEQGFVDKPNYQYFTAGPSVAQKLP